MWDDYHIMQSHTKWNLGTIAFGLIAAGVAPVTFGFGAIPFLAVAYVCWQKSREARPDDGDGEGSNLIAADVEKRPWYTTPIPTLIRQRLRGDASSPANGDGDDGSGVDPSND